MPRLPIADARQSLDFYTQMLGFTVACLWPEVRPTFLIVRRGGVRLAFDVAGSGAANAAESSTGFYIEVEDARAVHESIRERVRVEWGPEVYHYGRREFAIRDPDGYMIIFSVRTDDPPTCKM